MVYNPQQAQQKRTAAKMRSEGNGVFNALPQAPRATERASRTGMRISSPKPQAPPVRVMPQAPQPQPGQYSTGPQAAAQGAGPGVQQNAATQQQGAMSDPALSAPPMREGPAAVSAQRPAVASGVASTPAGGYEAFNPTRGDPYSPQPAGPGAPLGGLDPSAGIPSGTAAGPVDGGYDDYVSPFETVADPAASMGGGAVDEQGRSIDDVIAMLLGTDVANTEEEEALLKEMMGLQSGKAIADQRARFATAGLGGASALAGVEADIYGENARDTSQHIFDLRRDARDEEFERLMGGLSASAVDRGLDLRDEEREALLAALNEEIDIPEDNSIVGQGSATHDDAVATLDGWKKYMTGEDQGIYLDTVPEGATPTGRTETLPDGNEWTEYQTADGEYVFISTGNPGQIVDWSAINPENLTSFSLENLFDDGRDA